MRTQVYFPSESAYRADMDRSFDIDLIFGEALLATTSFLPRLDITKSLPLTIGLKEQHVLLVGHIRLSRRQNKTVTVATGSPNLTTRYT